MKKFTLILNSRERPQLLYGLFENIVQKTKNLEDIEVLVSFDSDDKDYIHFLSDLMSVGHPIVKVLYWEFKYRDQQLIRSYNRMASYARGEFIFVLNDDARIETQDWDELSYPILKEPTDGIVYGYTTCNSVDHHPTARYSSFPIISRKACDILGFFMPATIVTLGGDVLVYRIYEAAGKVVDLPIQMRHLLHETLDLVFSPDRTAADMRALSNEQLAWTTDITQYAEKLKNV